MSCMRAFCPANVRPALLLALLALSLVLSGCTAFQPRSDLQAQREAQLAAERDRNARLNARPPVNTTSNLYEGSLWRGAASWGNLLRDHRARYRGDLLTVSDLSRIIKVPEPVQEQQNPNQPGAQAQPGQGAVDQALQQQQALVDPVLAFLREQERIREEIDREQNEILRSLDSIEVEVVRVLANGNMLVRGVHPPIYRDRNRVKYIVTLEGIVRPSDVLDDNTVPSTKLSKAEYRIRRFVKRDPSLVTSVLRATGNTQTGGILDRFTDLATSPATGNRDTAVSPQ